MVEMKNQKGFSFCSFSFNFSNRNENCILIFIKSICDRGLDGVRWCPLRRLCCNIVEF